MYNVNVDDIKAKLFLKGITNEQENTNKAEEIVNSIHEYANKVEVQKEEKQARYNAAWELRNQYKEQVSSMESQLSTNPSKKRQYNQALSLFSNAEINSDIARDSLNHSISFASKMNNTAIIASSIF